MKNRKLNYTLKATLLGAIGFILGFLETPLFIFPDFYKIDISEITTIISGFALGPVFAVVTAAIKNMLGLFTTTTGGVGQLANFLVGSAFAVPAAFIYRQKKTKAHAITGLLIGTLGMMLMGVIMNKYVLLPFYANVMKFPLEAIIGMANKLNSQVTDLNSFLFWVVAPFNLIKGIILSVIALLIYKKISPLLHK